MDAIRNQWHFFQNEEIPEEWYVNQQAEKPTSSRHQESYWARTRGGCRPGSTQTSPACFVRIDHFWRKIGNLVDEFGVKKYPQLAKLAHCVLSLSHGNSTPERRFSVNKQLLAVHGYSTCEDRIIALHMVKDELLHVVGILEFLITRELLDSVSASWSKYEADCLARLEAENAERKKREQMKEENERKIVPEKHPLDGTHLDTVRGLITERNSTQERQREELVGASLLRPIRTNRSSLKCLCQFPDSR